MKPAATLVAAAFALSGILACFTETEWFIFVVHPFVFAQVREGERGRSSLA